MEKISHEHRVYESVDDWNPAILGYISKIDVKIILVIFYFAIEKVLYRYTVRVNCCSRYSIKYIHTFIPKFYYF